MIEKKIVVPEGMLKAAQDSRGAYADTNTRLILSRGLDAALRWLSENPIVPTLDQMQDLDEATLDVRPSSGDGYAMSRARIVEWQRRMFLDPEPEVEPLTMYIMRHFDDVELDKQTLRNRAEAAVSDFREHENRNVPEPEVPEAIKDLLQPETHTDDRSPEPGTFVECSESNRRILEAYRRGLARR